MYTSTSQGPCLRDDGLLAFCWLRAKNQPGRTKHQQRTSTGKIQLSSQPKSGRAPSFRRSSCEGPTMKQASKAIVYYVHLLRKLAESGRPGSIVLSCHECFQFFQTCRLSEGLSKRMQKVRNCTCNADLNSFNNEL